MKSVLIVNHNTGVQCGIYQAGINSHDCLAKFGKDFKSIHVSCEDPQSFEKYRAYYKPDLVVFNYVPGLFDWLSLISKTTKQICLLHEDAHVGYISCNLPAGTFDYYLSFGRKKEDSDKCFVLPRKLPAVPSITGPCNKKFTVGSFGFGMLTRGWLQIIDKVQSEFPCTHISFHMPFNSVVDPNGQVYALSTAEKCRKAITSPLTSLSITHDFMSKQDLVNFLASNDLNLFMSQDMSTGKASSSAIEFGLAAGRPIGISSSPLYKDLWSIKDKICVDNNNILDLHAQGTSILEPFYQKWSPENFAKEFEFVLNKIC